MRDLRSLAQRIKVLHSVPTPQLRRFDPLAVARAYAETIVRADYQERGRIDSLLEAGAAAYARSASASRAPTIVHLDLHHGNVLTADRVYFIDWEYAQLGDPLLDLACVLAYYPRAVSHAALLLNASGLEDRGATVEQLAELTSVFTLVTYLWYRARRIARTVPSTDLQLESTALRRLLQLAPDGQPRHTIDANSRDFSGAGKGNDDAAGD
jgi:thiamine kinase-like enzyme